MGPDESLYCTDDGDHTVRKCSLDGKVLLEIVGEGQPAPYMSGRPFHRCTHTALSPQGDIYISDGYGNAVVNKYSLDGRRILSWRRSGTEPGEFSLPHNVCCDADGWGLRRPSRAGRSSIAYGKLLCSTSRVVGQPKHFAQYIAAGVKRAGSVSRQLALEGMREEIERMVPLIRQVMKQTRARIFRGDTRSEGKIVSLFEPTTEIIRKGNASKPTEFGNMVKLQEAENQIVTAYEVYDRRPNDRDQLIAAIDIHQARLGRIPRLVAADAAFYSANNEATAKAKGVKRLAIPNRSTKSPACKREEKKRWFRSGQKWRTGCEGRISVAKRLHGLNRCRYRGDSGMKRWVGLGVIADNLVNIGCALNRQTAS